MKIIKHFKPGQKYNFSFDLRGTDELHELLIRPIKSKRSLKQNKYYWSIVVDLIAKEMAEEPQRVHEYLKAEFLSEQIEIGGKMVTIIKSTTSLKTDDFAEYLKKCELLGTEMFGIQWSPNGDI